MIAGKIGQDLRRGKRITLLTGVYTVPYHDSTRLHETKTSELALVTPAALPLALPPLPFVALCSNL